MQTQETRHQDLSDIIVVVRNERGVSLASIEGELITVLIAAEGQVIDQQPVRFRVADAVFLDLPARNYTVIVRHPSLKPTEARLDVTLPEKAMLGVKYFYNEAKRQLLRTELDMRDLRI
ncbi:hypothetical protein ACN4EK_23835 [Pantanalinema rosaneae CENA516]|uniref:hypothetical protein n=1 Tax=Pantanalinema rosaneae TaxID=1620701 RepID=UPI003D6F140A